MNTYDSPYAIIAALRAENAALKARVAELERELVAQRENEHSVMSDLLHTRDEREALAAKLEMEQGYVRNLQAVRNDLMVSLRITIKALEEVSEYPHSPTILADTARHALAKLGEK